MLTVRNRKEEKHDLYLTFWYHAMRFNRQPRRTKNRLERLRNRMHHVGGKWFIWLFSKS